MSAPPLSAYASAPAHLIALIGESETLALVERFVAQVPVHEPEFHDRDDSFWQLLEPPRR